MRDWKKTEQTLDDPWDNARHMELGVPRREVGKGGGKKLEER